MEHSSALRNTKTEGLGIWETLLMMIALEVKKKISWNLQFPVESHKALFKMKKETSIKKTLNPKP